MTEPTLRVMQLNAGSLLEAGWEERRHEVVSWIDHLEPDIVCLQEVWRNDSGEDTAGWIADNSTITWHFEFGGGSFPPAFTPDASIEFGSAVLSKWPIEAFSYQRLPVRPEANPVVQGVPWELLHVQTAGLDVFSTHLAAAPTDALDRQLQVLAIDEIVKEVRGDADALQGFGKKRQTMPPILCGDFNAEPDSDEIRFLTSLTALEGRSTFWQDSWRVAGDDLDPTAGRTQDWRTHSLAAGLNVHRKRIDYVFVGDPFMRAGNAGRVLSSRVVCNEARTGVMASDHAGVLADIVWPQRPAD